MSKNVFRRSFLKGAALGLSAFAVGVPVLAEEKGIYLPGTYYRYVRRHRHQDL